MLYTLYEHEFTFLSRMALWVLCSVTECWKCFPCILHLPPQALSFCRMFFVTLNYQERMKELLVAFAQNHFIRKSKTSIVLTSPGFLNVDIYFCVQCCYSLSCYIFAFSWKYTFNIRHTPVPLFKQHAALQWVMLLKWTRRCHCFAIRTHPNTKMWMTFILAA